MGIILSIQLFMVLLTGLRTIIRNDKLIKSLARHELLRQGNKEARRPNVLNPIRQKLRAVANVLSKCSKINPDIENMSQLLIPANFRTFMSACQDVSMTNDQMGLTVGGYIRQLLLLKISAAIQCDNADLQRETEQFRFLMDAHFLSEVSAAAGKRQRLKRINKPEELPLQQDMYKLADYLKSEILKVKKIGGPDDSLRLSKLLLCYLVHYNKRRPMEVQELTTESYLSEVHRGIQDNEEILNSLTFSERVMAKRYCFGCCLCNEITLSKDCTLYVILYPKFIFFWWLLKKIFFQFLKAKLRVNFTGDFANAVYVS